MDASSVAPGILPAPLDVSPPVELLARAIIAARKGAKERGVHQVRVTTRRIDAWLRLARMSTLRSDLRWLRTAASPARDLDVLLAREWPPEVRAQLKVDRAEARRSLAKVLDAPRTEALLLALRLLPPIPRARAEKGARRLVRKLLAFPVAPDDPEAVHRRRRMLRRVRYARELLGHRDEELIRLQDTLGVVSDLWIAGAVSAGPEHASALTAAVAAAEAMWELERPFLETLT